jgi:DUF1680 family protein
MERTLHNALLGALQPDGHWWEYLLELEGDAAPSICQYPKIKTNCCVMSGHRGLAMTSGWLDIRRDWQPGDVIAADFGEGLRFVRAPGGQRAVAVLRGPRRLSLPLRAENRPRSYWPKELHTWRFADFASLASRGIAGEATYRVWFPQPTLDR